MFFRVIPKSLSLILFKFLTSKATVLLFLILFFFNLVIFLPTIVSANSFVEVVLALRVETHLPDFNIVT